VELESGGYECRREEVPIDCSGDDECPHGYICYRGTCVPDISCGVIAGVCDGDCRAGYSCVKVEGNCQCISNDQMDPEECDQIGSDSDQTLLEWGST
jgi:hypothetical protein